MSFMSEHLILQKDDSEFPLDPQLLIHAMWKELFDLKIMDFMIWPFGYRSDRLMFPISIKDCGYEFETPEGTDLYEMHDTMPELTIGFPKWVERLKYADGPEFTPRSDGRNEFDYELETTPLSDAFSWPWILWSLYKGLTENEIILGLGKNEIDVLEESELQDALADEMHWGLSQHLTALPIAKPGPAFEGFVYAGNEAAEAPKVIQSILDLELDDSTPDDNVYCHALMLLALHPASTPASLELIASSTSAAREFLKFNPSATPDILAKIK